MNIKSILTSIILLFATVTSHAGNKSQYDWSPKRACQNMFLTLTPDQSEVAAQAVLSASNGENAYAVLQVSAWRKPNVVAFSGLPNSGKTFAVNEGLFPILQIQGLMPARVESAEFFSQAHAAEVLPTFEDFRVLAIDHLDLRALSFERYRELAHLVRERYVRGQSTILVLLGQQTHEDVQEFVSFATPGDVQYGVINFNQMPWTKLRN